MLLAGIDNDRFRGGRADFFTSSAADAILGIRFGIEDVILVNERNSVGRANLAASAAVFVVNIDDASVPN